jgi:hypothetical protein
MGERERPPCIDEEHCRTDWTRDRIRVSKTDKRGHLHWYCRRFRVLLRFDMYCLRVKRCAACRKEWG